MFSMVGEEGPNHYKDNWFYRGDNYPKCHLPQKLLILLSLSSSVYLFNTNFPRLIRPLIYTHKLSGTVMRFHGVVVLAFTSLLLLDLIPDAVGSLEILLGPRFIPLFHKIKNIGGDLIFLFHYAENIEHLL